MYSVGGLSALTSTVFMLSCSPHHLPISLRISVTTLVDADTAMTASLDPSLLRRAISRSALAFCRRLKSSAMVMSRVMVRTSITVTRAAFTVPILSPFLSPFFGDSSLVARARASARFWGQAADSTTLLTVFFPTPVSSAICLMLLPWRLSSMI